MKKVLVLRFSSFGDVVQSFSIAGKIKQKFPNSRVDFLTKSSFSDLARCQPEHTQVWEVPAQGSIRPLLNALAREKYDAIYDAHNSLRSKLIRWYLKLCNPQVKILVRKQKRWLRFLLFQFRINRFEQPFSGQRDFMEPLQKWGLDKSPPPAPQILVPDSEIKKCQEFCRAQNIQSFLVLAASAAHELKRWPLEYFLEIIRSLPQKKFVLVGGAQDTFLESLERPHQVYNLSGKLSYLETLAFVSCSEALLTNDTGVLHLGEQLGHRTIALMGPAPFGFPCRSTTTILQRELPCRPCSKHGQGPCVNPEYQACLRKISPLEVLQHL